MQPFTTSMMIIRSLQGAPKFHSFWSSSYDNPLITWWRLWCPPLTGHNWLIRVGPKGGKSRAGRASTFGQNHDSGHIFKNAPTPTQVSVIHCQNVVNQPLLARYVTWLWRSCGFMFWLMFPQHTCACFVGERLLPWLCVVMDQQGRSLPGPGKKASRYFWANFSCKGPH